MKRYNVATQLNQQVPCFVNEHIWTSQDHDKGKTVPKHF